MNRQTKRILMSLFGVIICGISVGIFKLAAMGVDPFQSLMSGLDQLIPFSFGLLYVIVNLVLLSFSLLADRHYIGLATFINLFLFGYITQFCYSFLQKLFPAPSVLFRGICLIIAIVIICFASALYMTADLGVSTYDAVALICANKWNLGPFKYVRITTDLICVVAGICVYLLGGGKASDIPTFVGIGTIITAFFMGPLIDFFNRTVAIPFLEK
ncbi:MAG: hypothetical protein Q4B26_17340 [Eubacteriales bacterium]|nr:hypothetical protein [Eubacteriales bacterium]